MINFSSLVTGKQTFLNLYPSNLIIDSVMQIVALWFNKLPQFNNPDTGYDARNKIFLATINNNSILASERQLLVQGIKAPYAIITNDTLNEQYSNQFIANYVGTGLKSNIASFSILTLENSVPNLLQPYSNTSSTNVFETDIIFTANYVRSNYAFEINVYANSYPELFDMQSYFTNLITTNRIHLAYIVSNLYLPNYLILSLSNQSITGYLNSGTMSLVDQNYFYVSITNPIYAKITSIQPQVQPYIQTQEQTSYKFTLRAEFDIGIINTIDVFYAIPIKGVSLYFSTSNIVSSLTNITQIINSYTSYTFSATQYYPYNSLTITISDTNFASSSSIYVLETGASTFQNISQFYAYLEKFLSFTRVSASQILIYDEVYNNSNIIVLYN